MRRGVVGGLLGFALALILVGCSKPPATMSLASEVSGRNVQITMTLQNFDLKKDGHAHLYLDDDPNPAMINRTTYIFHNLRPGQHVIRVQLTDPNHNPLKNPDLDQKLTVQVQ